MDFNKRIRDSNLSANTKDVLMKDLGRDATLLDVHEISAQRLSGIPGLGRVRLKELIEAGIVEISDTPVLNSRPLILQGWKLITSAPTDGSAILVATKKFPIVTISWWDGKQWTDPCQTGALSDVGYWRPLPSPPLR